MFSFRVFGHFVSRERARVWMTFSFSRFLFFVHFFQLERRIVSMFFLNLDPFNVSRYRSENSIASALAEPCAFVNQHLIAFILTAFSDYFLRATSRLRGLRG